MSLRFTLECGQNCSPVNSFYDKGCFSPDFHRNLHELPVPGHNLSQLPWIGSCLQLFLSPSSSERPFLLAVTVSPWLNHPAVECSLLSVIPLSPDKPHSWSLVSQAVMILFHLGESLFSYFNYKISLTDISSYIWPHFAFSQSMEKM